MLLGLDVTYQTVSKFFAMMTSASIVKLTNNKYIVISQGTYATYYNKYNYDKIRLQIISKFKFLCEKIKLKHLKYIFVFFMNTWNMEK